MTKKEIVKSISDEIGVTQLKIKEIVQKTFDAIIDALVTEGRIELRNFGVFEVKKRAARKARNPRTGDSIDVAEKYFVNFKPGKEMESRMAQLLTQNQQQEKLERVERQVQKAARPVGDSDGVNTRGSVSNGSDANRLNVAHEPTGSD